MMSNLVHAYLALVGSDKSLGVVLSQACVRHPADAVFTMNHRSVLSLMALRSVATPEQVFMCSKPGSLCVPESLQYLRFSVARVSQ